MQGTARSGNGLGARTDVVDQGSEAPEKGPDGGDSSGSGLLRTRRHRRVRARTGASSRRVRALITGQARLTAEVESRAREQRTQLKWLTAGGLGCGCRAREVSKKGRAWREYEWNENEASPPPPPPPPPPFFFYRAVWVVEGSRGS